MTNSCLTVEGLGKAFREFQNPGRRFLSWFGVPAAPDREHWALRGISFSLKAGDTLAVVGQNGAGKSTLLKLITGTLRQTEGQVLVNGRVAAILELGLGFHPELTGRQNACNALGLMSFSNKQIESVMGSIEKFAEIGDYFDEPARTYSNGMLMRAAFSVVTAVQPEILIIDEALSVGDAYFQHKCFARIREFQKMGTTLLFVSHDDSAVKNLCERAILLEKGLMIKEGRPAEVMDFYNAIIAEQENRSVEVTQHASGQVQTISGTGEARVEEIVLLDRNGNPVEFVNVGDPVELVVRARCYADIPRLVLGYMIKDRLGQVMYGTNTHHTEQALEDVQEGQWIEFRISFPMNLGPGSYSITVALTSTETHLVKNYEWKDLAYIFNVSNCGKPVFVGCLWMPQKITVKSSSEI